MKLTVKLVSVLLLAVVCVNVIKGYLDLRHQAWVFEQLTRDEAATIGDAMEEVVAVAWRQGGQSGALELIRKASEQDHQMEMRWVWLDAPPNDPYRPAASPHQLVDVALRQHQPIEARHSDGNNYLNIYWPVTVDTSRKGALELYKPTADLDVLKRTEVYRKLMQTVATILVGALVATAMGFVVVGRPLERLMEKIRRVGRGDFSGPVHLRTHDELTELGDSINRMCNELAQSQAVIDKEMSARIAAMEQLRHVDRIRTVGRLASGMAHEMGTPLNVVSGRAELIASGKLPPEEIVASARTIKAEAEKMTRIIRQLLDFARRTSPRRLSVELHHVVRQTLDLLSSLADEHHVALSLSEVGDPPTAMIDVGQIQQVLTNVILNAIQSMPEGGRVEIDLRVEHVRPPEGLDAREGDYCRIAVRDQGEGISAEDMEHLFEPFFTTKDVGEGTGLGLSISYGIVREHGGWIEATSEPGQGSCFSIYLPEGIES